MEINNLTSYLQKLTQLDSTTSNTYNTGQNQTTVTMPTEGVDMYIPSGDSGSEVLTSDNYNDILSQMSQMMPPPPPPMDLSQVSTDDTTSVDGVSSTTSATTAATDASTSTDTAAESVLSILNEISSTMHVNADSIADTMDELGMTVSDLYDSDKMEELVNALNQGAADRGLPTIDNLDSIISSLSDFATSSASDTESSYSITDEQFQELLKELQEILFGTSDSTTDSTTSDSTDSSTTDAASAIEGTTVTT